MRGHAYTVPLYQNHFQADPTLLGLDGLSGTRTAGRPLVVAQSDLARSSDKDSFLAGYIGSRR